jgi:hypothetical protein
VPVANQWVVVHRVGPDRAGPLDSTRSGVSGRYHLHYRASGDSSALYFVSTTYDGVAYFTAPLRAPVVAGDDGTITVFDTTSGPVAIRLGGRHLIVGAAEANGRRPIGEVYDLQNDSTVTVVARNGVTPVWSAFLPRAATGFELNTNGDLAAGAISRRDTLVGLFAPLSPGIRQLAFTYQLPASAFPLNVDFRQGAGVFELLVQEPSAKVTGARVREMSPVSTDGRMFRRFLAQDVPVNAVIRIDVPRMVGGERNTVYLGIGIAFLIVMTIALFVAGRRTRPAPVRPASVAPTGTVPRTANDLVRAIADLDAQFERHNGADADERARYEARRSALKAELAELLAGTRAST